MRGVVLVNRVPGNFHISAHSKSHSFQHGMLNMSHYVEAMSFGKMLSPCAALPPPVAFSQNSGFDNLPLDAP